LGNFEPSTIKDESKKSHFRYLFLAFSLVVHFLILMQRLSISVSPASKQENNVTIRIKLREDPPLPKTKRRKQIVNNEHTPDRTPPKDTDFLGEKDQSYKEQTVAKKIRRFKKGVPSKRKKKDLKLSDLSVKRNGDVSPIQNQNVQSSNNDYIQNVKKGDATHLNTQQYKYWSFFNRIRQMIEPRWEHLLQEFLRERYHQKITGPIVTIIRVIMDEYGNLIATTVLSTCGIQPIDEIAITAIQSAAPFRGVPTGMLHNRRATFEWHFVLSDE
jgi:hypothetical protein